MRRKIIIGLLILSVLLLLMSYIGNAQTKAYSGAIIRPNIVWITCEDMSPHLSSFGEETIQTPNLDALANDGIKYTNAYTCAGVCAPSRNGIITAMYPVSIGGDNMRNYMFAPGKKGPERSTSRILPSYSIVPPEYVKCFPEYMRKEMYYCTNNPKEDYQFEAPLTVWDESSTKAHWRNRPDGKPFFAVFNIEVTHESRLWLRDSLPLEVDPSKVKVPPYYPDVPEVRHGIARQLSNVVEMDRQVGRIIKELKDSGLYDNTFIFFYSDHGDGLPYVKREITKRGLHIPLIIKFPGNDYAGQVNNQLISAIDFGPTVLSVAGITIPWYMHGQAFLGSQKRASRKYVFAARDRMDEQVDRVRSVFDGRYQYLRNYMPEKPYYQDISYRLQIPMMKKLLEMRDNGQLNALQMRWFNTKPVEELYDTEKDPHQQYNLAANPAFKSKLSELRTACTKWLSELGDLHELPELQLRNKMWGNDKEAPVTAMPVITRVKDGYMISCATPGASIGYQYIPKEGTWKMGLAWKVYHYGSISHYPDVPLKNGDKLIIRAQRIGYLPSQMEFVKNENN